MGEMRPDSEKAINKIVQIINEAVIVGGMSKRDTDALKDALRTLVSAAPVAKTG